MTGDEIVVFDDDLRRITAHDFDCDLIGLGAPGVPGLVMDLVRADKSQ